MEENLFNDKINELKTELEETKAQLRQAKAEKAALQLKGMGNISEDVEELATLRNELKIEREKLEETEAKVGKLDNFEMILAQQQEEISNLTNSNNSLKLKLMSGDSSNDEELSELKDKLLSAEQEISRLKQENLDNSSDQNHYQESEVQELIGKLDQAYIDIDLLNQENTKLTEKTTGLESEILTLKTADNEPPLESTNPKEDVAEKEIIEKEVEAEVENTSTFNSDITTKEEVEDEVEEKSTITNTTSNSPFYEPKAHTQPLTETVESPEIEEDTSDVPEIEDTPPKEELKEKEQSPKPASAGNPSALPDDVMKKWLGG